MSEKRKDSKGRVLRTGESQRKDLLYQYRYTDAKGKRHTVYSPDLNELREKEKKIQIQLNDGIDYTAGEITVIQLLERYISLKQGVRYNTKINYKTVMNLLKRDDFGYRQVSYVTMSDAKQWFLHLHNKGRGYGSIVGVKGIVRPAFQMAYDDNVIRRNPFDFRVADIVPNDSTKRVALTDEQQEALLNFVRDDTNYYKYYDELVVLLETGMRVSEFCGLTIGDLDFTNRKIRVDHQLSKKTKGIYFVEKPKTENGVRFVYMTPDTYHSLKRILEHRETPKTEMIIDGYSGFILLNRDGKPKTAVNVRDTIRRVGEKFRERHPDIPMPHITPHVLRHTFCTNMVNSGMDIQNVQYLMGHAKASTTLNVYTHANYENAAKQMASIVDFQQISKHEQRLG